VCGVRREARFEHEFTCGNRVLGKKTNALHTTYIPLLHHAVWLTAVIDKARQIAFPVKCVCVCV